MNCGDWKEGQLLLVQFDYSGCRPKGSIVSEEFFSQWGAPMVWHGHGGHSVE